MNTTSYLKRIRKINEVGSTGKRRKWRGRNVGSRRRLKSYNYSDVLRTEKRQSFVTVIFQQRGLNFCIRSDIPRDLACGWLDTAGTNDSLLFLFRVIAWAVTNSTLLPSAIFFCVMLCLCICSCVAVAQSSTVLLSFQLKPYLFGEDHVGRRRWWVSRILSSCLNF